MIAANVTLIQPPYTPYTPYLSVLGGAIAASIGALAVYITTNRAQKQEKRREKLNKQRESYSRLRGQHMFVAALLHSYGRAFFESQRALETSKQNWSMMQGSLKEGMFLSNPEEALLKSQAYQQFQKAHQLSIELYIELSKGQRDLWEIIGSIEILFPETEGFISKIQQALKEYELSDWAKEANQEVFNAKLKSFILEVFGPAVEDLLTYLKSKIKQDQDK